MEDVTEKIDKCPKWKIKKKLKFFVCLTHIVQIAALRAMIVKRYYLNKTVLRWKVPKVMGGGKWSLTLERAMILCL